MKYTGIISIIVIAFLTACGNNTNNQEPVPIDTISHDHEKGQTCTEKGTISDSSGEDISAMIKTVQNENAMGYIREFTKKDGGYMIAIDYVEWLDGDAALKASEEDGAGDGCPGGFYIRNRNTKLREFRLADNVQVMLISPEGYFEDEYREVAIADFYEKFGKSHLKDLPYNIAVADSMVIHIKEQYVP